MGPLGGGKPSHVADDGGQRGGGDNVDAGDRHQAPDVLVAERLLGDQLVDLGQLAL